MGSAITSDSTQIVEAEKTLDKILTENKELKARYDDLLDDHKRASDAESEIAHLKAKLASLQKQNIDLVAENERLRVYEERTTILEPRVTSLLRKIKLAIPEQKVPPFPSNTIPIPMTRRRRRPPPPPPLLSPSSDEEFDCESSDELEDQPNMMTQSLMRL